ncbi:MAG: NTP transferase domain-containing protein [Thiomargarita sp.]|nr:NTP transferase domain-containing protein [Thiomargarita sp.]
MKAVIQAGGKGTRLRPYTLVLPKPLMPVGELPVIEILIKWLRRYGVQEIYITTGYLGHLIRALCGDGSQWDCKIIYSEETEPLGTIGALGLIREHLDETFLVLNGDLITDLDLRAFYRYHLKHEELLTVGVTNKTVKIDLGVIETEGNYITEFLEKPSFNYQVSMGIYCMQPEILNHIPKAVPFGFDDLMYSMLDHKLPVQVYQHNGSWMDIGRAEDFQKAQELFQESNMPMLGL